MEACFAEEEMLINVNNSGNEVDTLWIHNRPHTLGQLESHPALQPHISIELMSPVLDGVSELMLLAHVSLM